MDRTPDRRGGRAALRAVLAAVRIGVLALLLSWPALGAVQDGAEGAAGADPRCVRGADQDRPARALIRTDQGQVRQVSFDVAWEVYQGHRPGTVLAVCVSGSRRG